MFKYKTRTNQEVNLTKSDYINETKTLRKKTSKFEKIRRKILINCWRNKPIDLIPKLKEGIKSKQKKSKSFDSTLIKKNFEILKGINKKSKLDNKCSITLVSRGSLSLDRRFNYLIMNRRNNNDKKSKFLRNKIKNSNLFEIDIGNKENVSRKKEMFLIKKKISLISMVDKFLKKNEVKEFYYFVKEGNFYEWTMIKRKNLDFKKRKIRLKNKFGVKIRENFDIATLSASGIMFQIKGKDLFFKLQQFKTEYLLYKKLNTISFIKNLKKIKFFKFWNMNIKKIKFSKLNFNLEKNLFKFQPFYNKTIYDINSLENQLSRFKFFNFNLKHPINVNLILSSQKKIINLFYEKIKKQSSKIIAEFSIYIKKEIEFEKDKFKEKKENSFKSNKHKTKKDIKNLKLNQFFLQKKLLAKKKIFQIKKNKFQNKIQKKKNENQVAEEEEEDEEMDNIIKVFRKNNEFANKIKKLFLILKLKFEKFQFSLIYNNLLEILMEIQNLTKEKINGFKKDSFIKIELQFDEKKEKLIVLPHFKEIKSNFYGLITNIIENIFKSVKINMFRISKEYLYSKQKFLEFIKHISDCIKSSTTNFYKNLLKHPKLLKIINEIMLNLKKNYDRIKFSVEKLTKLDLYKKIKNFKKEIKKKFIFKEFQTILTDIINMKKKLENIENKKRDGIYLISISKIKENLLDILNQGLFQFKFVVPDFILKKTKDFYCNLLKSSKLINMQTNNFNQFFDFYTNFKKLEEFLDNINSNFSILSDYNKIFYIPNFQIQKPENFSNLINRVSFLKNRISFEYIKKKKEIEIKKINYMKELNISNNHFYFSYAYKKKLFIQYCQEFIGLEYLNEFLINFNNKFNELLEIVKKIEKYNQFFVIFKEKKSFNFNFDLEKLNCLKNFFEDIKFFKDKLTIINNSTLKEFEKKAFEDYLINFEEKIKNFPFEDTKIIKELTEIIRFYFLTFNFIKISKKRRKKRSLRKWKSGSSSREEVVIEQITKKSSMKIKEFKIFLKKFY